MLYAFCALCCSCSIHGCVTAADNYHILSDIQTAIICLEITKEFQCVYSLTLLKLQGTWLAGSDRKNHCIIALCFQLCYRCNFCIGADLYSHLFNKGNIFVNGIISNTEARDHVADHTACFFLFFKNSYSCALSCKEISCSNTGRTAAYNSNLLTVWFSGFDLTDQLLIALLCCNQLSSADIYRFLIEITGTFIHTVMRT